MKNNAVKNNMLRARFLLPALALFTFAACSSEPQKPAEQKAAPKPAETVTAREAFQKLYITARSWAADARPVRLESQPAADSDGHDGKAAIWRALFASPGRRTIEAFVWSGSAATDAPERGISHGTEDTFNPTNASTQPFDMQFLKIESDAAFETAQKHGGEKELKTDPKLPVGYLLDWDANKSQLVWHVFYGASRSDAKLAVDVDATTGLFLRVEK